MNNMAVATALMNSTSWISDALDRLAAPCGYHAAEPPSAEPTALAALALIGAGKADQAEPHLKWLAGAQNAAGSIAPFSELTDSAWPTPLAILAAVSAARSGKSLDSKSGPDISSASSWLLAASGKPVANSPDFGHNGQLIGWPWVIGTHSWQEPTAWSVLALKALGQQNHPRTREGIRVLVDRLLPSGGCNYGNTTVLGQLLRPHIEPTGVALLALAGESVDDPRIELSLKYLTNAVTAETTPISLSYGLIGLTAHHRRPAESAQWLEGSYRDTVKREASPLAIALLVLAAQERDCPLLMYTA
jgi:hypothetical protein